MTYRSQYSFRVKFAVALILVFVFAFMAGCHTSSDSTLQTLQKSGFTAITVGGLAPWTCGADDMAGRSFVAKNPQGMLVEGVVCCGLLKGCTVRF